MSPVLAQPLTCSRVELLHLTQYDYVTYASATLAYVCVTYTNAAADSRVEPIHALCQHMCYVHYRSRFAAVQS